MSLYFLRGFYAREDQHVRLPLHQSHKEEKDEKESC